MMAFEFVFFVVWCLLKIKNDMEMNKCIIISNEACSVNFSLLDQNIGRVGGLVFQAGIFSLFTALSSFPGSPQCMAQEFMVITHG